MTKPVLTITRQADAKRRAALIALITRPTPSDKPTPKAG